jgi:hypothetical protein
MSAMMGAEHMDVRSIDLQLSIRVALEMNSCSKSCASRSIVLLDYQLTNKLEKVLNHLILETGFGCSPYLSHFISTISRGKME